MTPVAESSESQQDAERGPAKATAEKTGPSRRNRWIVLTVVGLLVCAVVAFAAFQWRAAHSAPATPAGAAATGIPVGRANAPVTVDVYEDLQCATCRTFTLQSAATFDTLINSGAVKVVYHPVAFLDRMSTTRYSSRAAEAAACAAQAGVFRRYVSLLYANQPAANGPGLTNDQLIQLGRQLGAGGGFADCVTGNTYGPWVSAVSDAATDSGVSGLPTVLVNGRRIDNTRAALLQAVQAHH